MTAAHPSQAATLATKDRILDAAEILFAQHGFDAASMRMISSAAEVNLAAINYHFQSKEALMEAVYVRRVGPVNERRIELLNQYIMEAGGAPLTPERILEAFSQPVLEVFDQWPHISLLMVRVLYLQDRDSFRRIFTSLFQTVGAYFLRALVGALPHLTQEQIFLRMQYFLGSFLHIMASGDAMRSLSKGAFTPPSQSQMIRQLIHFTAAGMRAPALEMQQ